MDGKITMGRPYPVQIVAAIGPWRVMQVVWRWEYVVRAERWLVGMN